MLKTLIVSYLPRGERSTTKKLVDSFLKSIENKETEVEQVDLLQNPPDFFTEANLAAYYKRNYGGQELTAEEAAAIASMDAFTAQFKTADVFVLAYPVYNFSFPAMVKAYIDSIALKGETWDIGEAGYIGLMDSSKKALVLTSSGGEYTEANNNVSLDHSSSLAHQSMNFLGFGDVRVISAAGINAKPEQKEEILAETMAKIDQAVSEWYS